MAKKKFNVERLAKIALGAVGAKMVNGLANKALASMPPQTQDMARKGLPLAKVAAGAYLMKTSKSATMRDIGTGIVAAGGLEVIETFAPQVFDIGTTGDLFLNVGTSIDFPVLAPGSASALPTESYGMDVNIIGYQETATQMAAL